MTILGTLALLVVLLATIASAPPLRRALLTKWILGRVKRHLPRLGATERIALDAGTVWWDGELFSGRPDWKKLVDFKLRGLSDRERAFLDGPVEELCRGLNAWEIEQSGDLPSEVWRFIKEHGFWGMIVPEEYGGLGFSAAAHSAVITKLASRSVVAAVTVMVPNSLGPAELILHYGTEAQKRHFLPRLAGGEEIPCFALTGPEAGSDAAAMQSTGVVCRALGGEELVGIRLNWRKRYITLGPVSTLIGLAFKLVDPEHIFGETTDLGITLALVPSNLPGIEIGERHDPMGVPFQNGPNVGRDVFVPLDAIIGGRAGAGQGWRMLMESLAAGRSISLPALSVGAAELCTRIVGSYATIREQFDTPIGRFEGIEEPLARIGGLTYMMNAARWLTAGALDAGERPAVISAIVKAYLTECMRTVVNAALDIRAGAGICRGPRNLLAQAYMATPIAITVEGANILTRSMIVYGQGALRCHPYAREEILSAGANDLQRFDRALFAHLKHAIGNATRSLVLGLTNGALARIPVRGPTRPFMARFARMSAAFAVVSEAAMMTLGSHLKRREKISGRLADGLAWLYLGSATLKRFMDEGQNEIDRPFVQWACEQALFEIQTALVGILENLPNRLVAWSVRRLVFPLGARYRPPCDELGGQVARALLEDREGRSRLTRDIFIPPPDEPGLGLLESALDKIVPAHAIEAKIRDAVRAGRIDRGPGDELADRALEAGIITAEERAHLHAAQRACEDRRRCVHRRQAWRSANADERQRARSSSVKTGSDTPGFSRWRAFDSRSDSPHHPGPPVEQRDAPRGG